MSSISASDFIIHTNHFPKGAYGTVFPAIRKSDNLKCAMKFFGYTQCEPSIREIEKEIVIMRDFLDVPGVSNFLGSFCDTPEGMMPHKNKKMLRPYPVIVMSRLEGGDLFDRITGNKNQGTVAKTERDLSVLFRSALLSLKHIHELNYLHRDLKLENMMLNSAQLDSGVTIIDFGNMVRLKEGQTVYTD